MTYLAILCIEMPVEDCQILYSFDDTSLQKLNGYIPRKPAAMYEAALQKSLVPQ